MWVTRPSRWASPGLRPATLRPASSSSSHDVLRGRVLGHVRVQAMLLDPERENFVEATRIERERAEREAEVARHVAEGEERTVGWQVGQTGESRTLAEIVTGCQPGEDPSPSCGCRTPGRPPTTLGWPGRRPRRPAGRYHRCTLLSHPWR